MAKKRQSPSNDDSMLMEDDFGAAFLDLDDDMELVEEDASAPTMASEASEAVNRAPVEEVVEVVEEEVVEVEGLDQAELPVDVYETEDKLVLKARVAGVEKSDIDLEFSDGIVTIKGVLTSNDSDEITQYHLQECYWGKFYRQVKLPVAVKEGDDSIDAVLDEGVLILTFIKEKSDTAKKIRIS